MMQRLIRGAFRRCGFDVVRYQPPSKGAEEIRTTASLPHDLSADDRAVVQRIAGYTMTTVSSQAALIQAVRHLVRWKIDGSFVECGVWRGGSSMAAALTLVQEGATDRHLYLYDTFQGMSPPQDVDVNVYGESAMTLLDRDHDKRSDYWGVAGLAEVRRNMESTGYPINRVHCVQGPVETTVPSHSPAGSIAMLRLDTDWYASTKHELTHLFPLLCRGGILIIDDYGFWQGATRAVDEYFASMNSTFYLHRIDRGGRLLIKE